MTISHVFALPIELKEGKRNTSCLPSTSIEIDADYVSLALDAILHTALAILGNMKTAVPPVTLPKPML